jgi:predicted O-methyltransferase YrrM
MSFYPSYQEQFSLLDNEHKKDLEQIPHLESVEGWLLLIEATELFMLTSQIYSKRPIVCEIGTWKGKSSYIFATALKTMRGVLYSIDPFDGDGDDASKESYQKEIKKMNTTLLQNFKDTLKRFNLVGNVNILPLKSEDARLEFSEQRIDILFIDGNHEYESVERDYNLWSPLIPSGGKIILHDVGAVYVDGPRRVMQKYVVGSSIWKNVRMLGEMVIAERV